MEARAGRGANAVQCMRAALCETDAQNGDEQGVVDGTESEAQDTDGLGITEQPLERMSWIGPALGRGLDVRRFAGRTD